MSDPVVMVAKPRSDWKKRALRAEANATLYRAAASVAAIVAVASLLFALTR